MSKTIKYIFASLYTLSVYFFFVLFYYGHIYNAEFGSIFLFSGDYFFQTVLCIGGLSNYLYDFITQFFHVPALGAAFLALILLFDSLFVAGLCKTRTTMSFILSFLPSTAIMFFVCKYGCGLSPVLPAVVLLGSLSLASVFIQAPFLFQIIFVPAVFYLFGPLSFIYPFVILSKGCKKSAVCAFIAYLVCAGLSYFFVTPMLSATFFDINVFTGVKAANTLLPRIIPIVIAIGIICLPPFEEDLHFAVPLSTFLLCYGSLAAVMLFSSNFNVERVLRYDNLLQRGDWNGILRMSNKKKPVFYEEVCCTDLALAMKGKLADELFEYPQGGPMAMVPVYSQMISPLYTAEILKRLGLFPPAQRYAFEAQVGGGVGEANARCYKILAELNAALGFEAVAQKYADRLSHTLFYSGWTKRFDASKREHCISDSLKTREFYYESDFGNMLSRCLKADPDNTVAREYMLCWYILSNNYDGFAINFDPKEYMSIPKLYQEAYALYWAQNHDDFSMIPSFVSPSVVKDLATFAQLRSKDDYAIKKKYGKTCWYYTFYSKEQSR